LNDRATRFCKDHPDIIFIREDKGNVTVALNKDEYVKKIEIMLLDQNIYITVQKNPMVTTGKKLNSIWFHF